MSLLQYSAKDVQPFNTTSIFQMHIKVAAAVVNKTRNSEACTHQSMSNCHFPDPAALLRKASHNSCVAIKPPIKSVALSIFCKGFLPPRKSYPTMAILPPSQSIEISQSMQVVLPPIFDMVMVMCAVFITLVLTSPDPLKLVRNCPVTRE